MTSRRRELFFRHALPMLICLMVVQVWPFWEGSQRHRRSAETAAGVGLFDSLGGTAAAAESVSVFGPKTYLRTTKKPNVYTDRFKSVTGKGTLYVLNGEEDGSHRISTAVITLNGKDVLATNDFNQNVYRLRKVVDLAFANTLVVDLRSKPGSYLTIEIVYESENTAPTADAGPDQTVRVTRTVVLNGTGSSDPDGDSLTYRWSFVTKPLDSAASLSDTTAANPTFLVDKPGEYVLQLIIHDGYVSSSPDTVTITTENSPPVADAGPDQTAYVTGTVHLDGSRSTDVDGNALTFRWSLQTNPADSLATLTDPTAVSPSFVADRPGTYVAQLIVNDGAVDSGLDTVTTTTQNNKPVANAGPDQTVSVTQTVTLYGSSSTDVDGDPLTFLWSLPTRPAGSLATLSDYLAVSPTFVADKPGTYIAQLVVNDGTIDSDPDTATITTQNSKPVANAGPDRSVFVGDTATLDGSGSTDVDGDLLSFGWSISAKPSDSIAALNDPSSVMPSFLIDRPGSYVAQLVVNDGTLDSDPDTATITTQNSKPVANAGSDQAVSVGDTVTLDGSGSTDVDGESLGFAWALTARPDGSAATLVNPSTAAPSFLADRPGTYVAQLIVSDGTIDSDPDTVTVTTRNSRPVSNAGPDQSVSVGDTVTLNGSGSSDADGDFLSYAWALISVPDGSAAVLAEPLTAAPHLAVDVAGIYIAQLIVNDGSENSLPDTVTITAAAIPFVSVPDVTGLSKANAESAIAAAGLVVSVVTTGYSATVPAGNVISQDPSAGTSVPIGSSVSLAVSLGPAMVTVRNVVEMTQAVAQAAITGAGLTVGAITTANSSTISAGSVISQNPLAGSSVPQGSAVALTISLGPAETLPPDPMTVAPPIDPTVATTMAVATEFLYTGANPIQTGVAPGTIDSKRVSVLRGKVLDRNNNPLNGVTITILNHPEFGQTLSRLDGMFDIAVNGGGYLTVNYQKSGYLPAQRQINAPWKDYAWLPDVVLTQLDSQVTAVDLTSSEPIQVARGSGVTDEDGTRQATLLIPQGITAQMVMPNGSTQPITSLTVRASEYTVGPNGPNAMPAELPPTSGYTYAVELSADEAIAAGANEVRFSQPLYYYVENFLGFPVGTAVPAGYYDRQKGQWIASDNGRVVKVLSVTGGLADLDFDGTGLAADAAALASHGVTAEERERVAQLYAAGQTLWRVPLSHFSPWDCNWGISPPEDAVEPEAAEPANPMLEEISGECGSIIGCETQTLGEAVSLGGTPFQLLYQSDRVPGAHGHRSPEIALTGATIPASLLSIVLEVEVAGQRFSQLFPAAANQRTVFSLWDGKDVRGRLLQGRTPATFRIGYVYRGVYQRVTRFGYNGNGYVISDFTGLGVPARQNLVLWKTFTSFLGGWTAPRGGWSLSEHHAYDTSSSVLYLGDGRVRSARTLGNAITTVAGGGWVSDFLAAVPATQASLGTPKDVVVGPDGSLYIVTNSDVGRVTPDGLIRRIAGSGRACTYYPCGIPGPATGAQLLPYSADVGPDGTLYITSGQTNQVLMVRDGFLSVFAGTGGGGFAGDGGPATQAQLSEFVPRVRVGPDGSVYIVDQSNHRIRRVGTDGIISTVAGSGATGRYAGRFDGDDGLATSAGLNTPMDVAVGRDGSLYIVDNFNHRIRKVGVDGIITTVAGSGTVGEFRGGFGGDGGPATSARLNRPRAVTVAPDGSLYIAENSNSRIRRVDSDGIINTVAGTGAFAFGGDGGVATRAILSWPAGVALDADGNLYIADSGNGRVRKVSPSHLPGLSVGDLAFASADGSELYLFDPRGRHLQTLDALTGAVRYQFAYSAEGDLTSVTDAAGQVTTIERVDGTPIAVVAPGGQRTALSLNGDGWLSSVTDPGGGAHTMTYSADGLLQTFTDPNSNLHQFLYDGFGRLIQDDDPAGGSKVLTRTEQANGYTVTTTTALGRERDYQVERLPTGGLRRAVTDAGGNTTVRVTSTDGTEQTTSPDGTVTTVRYGPDPRWGLQAPITQSVVVQTPGGRTRTVTTARTATLADPNNLLSLTRQTDTVTDNGRVTTLVYDAATRTLTATSPGGRVEEAVLDDQGWVVQQTPPGTLPVDLTYDTTGLLTSVGQGPRTYALAYDAQRDLKSITDPLSRTASFTYDLAGRVTSEDLPGGRTVRFGYDANGNVTSLVPPGRPAHSFAYTALDQTSTYTPPAVAGAGALPTGYAYDLDRNLAQVDLPDGGSIVAGYAPLAPLVVGQSGRLESLKTPWGTTAFTRDPEGRLESVTAPDSGTIAYAYDGFLGTGETWAGQIPGTLGYTYDNNFRLTALAVNGTAVAYTYDADGLLTAAGSLTVTRDAATGRPSTTVLGVVSTAQTYNDHGELDTFAATAGATALYSYTLTRDLAGRITRKAETVQGVAATWDYGYDAAGRLATVTVDGTLAATYTYDGNGNRLSKTSTGGTQTGTYDAQDRLTAYGTAAYAWGPNGDLVSKTRGGQVTGYDYDAVGTLRAALLPNGTSLEYVLDGANRRIGKKIDGALAEGFLYSGRLRPVARLDGSGAVSARFVYGLHVNVPEYLTTAGVTYRLLTDHLGSPRLVVNTATGAVVQRLDYDEFGNVLGDTNPGFQPFGFAGGLYDRDTGLVRFGARDYDPEVGRWTAKDPIGFKGVDTDLYGYVFGDPLNLLDSEGLIYHHDGITGGGLTRAYKLQEGRIRGGGSIRNSLLLTNPWFWRLIDYLKYEYIVPDSESYDEFDAALVCSVDIQKAKENRGIARGAVASLGLDPSQRFTEAEQRRVSEAMEFYKKHGYFRSPKEM